METESGSTNFSIGSSAQEQGMAYVPECYVLPPEDHPNQDLKSECFPTIDIASLRGNAYDRSLAVEDIGKACRQLGLFQIINHGISQKILDDALAAVSEFFELPNEQKAPFMSNDVNKPVRYDTGIKYGLDKIQFWRVFLKHYVNPLHQWVHSWPSNPPNYRENIGKYTKELMRVSYEVTATITESLGLGPKYLGDNIENGMQVMTINHYPP